MSETEMLKKVLKIKQKEIDELRTNIGTRLDAPMSSTDNWTWRDEINDILDKLENYEEQHGVLAAPGELVRELRALVRRLG